MREYLREEKLLRCEDIAVRMLPSGRCKVIGLGVPKYHLTDWAGENLRHVAFPGQPLRGFESVSDALKWLFERYTDKVAALNAVTELQLVGTWNSGNPHAIAYVDFQKRIASNSYSNPKKPHVWLPS